MSRRIPAAGFLAICLVTAIFMAGCMSQNAPGPTAAQQPVVTPQPPEQGGPQVTTPAAEVSPAAPDQGLVSDDAGNIPSQAETFNASEGTTLASDSPDLGDILP